MKKLIYGIAMALLIGLCIWMVIILAGPAQAAPYVPEVHGYDASVDYMARMVEAAEDGSPWALAMGRVYEQLRNEKIDDRGMDYAKTDFFKSTDAKKVRVLIAEYLNPPEPEPEMDEDEVEMLACVIYQEAGGDAYSDLCRMYVGDVVLNRVDDPRFPDTLEGVLLQPSQYGRYSWTGIVWPSRAQYAVEAEAVERAYDTARKLLSGSHSELYGAGYIWQAEFPQGTDIIYLDGLYFGR